MYQNWLIFGVIHYYTLLKFQFQLKTSSPRAWHCHHHASSWGWDYFADAFFWAKCNLWYYGQKNSTLLLSDQNILFYVVLEDWMYFFLLQTFFFYSGDWCHMQYREQPVLAINCFNSFNIAIGLLAASWPVLSLSSYKF